MKFLRKQSKKKISKMEFCVLCGRLTEYTTDKPIEKRRGYVTGCGQLCKDCFEAVNKKKMFES